MSWVEHLETESSLTLKLNIGFFFLIIKKNISIGVLFLYDIVLVSDVQQSESVSIYANPLFFSKYCYFYFSELKYTFIIFKILLSQWLTVQYI